MSRWRDPGASVLHSGLTPLLLSLVFAFYSRHLKRNWRTDAAPSKLDSARTLASSGMGGFLASHWGAWISIGAMGGGFSGSPYTFVQYVLGSRQIPLLAALAAAAGISVFDGITQAPTGTTPWHSRPRLAFGLVAGIVAELVITLTGVPAMSLSPEYCANAFVGAVIALLVYVLLATNLKHRGWMGDNLAVFVTTGFAAICSVALRLICR